MGYTAQPVRLTPEEKRLYGSLFRTADSQQVGVITGAAAVEFFKKSKLSPAILAEVNYSIPTALGTIPNICVDMDDRRYRKSGVSNTENMVYRPASHCPCPKGRTAHTGNGK